MIRYGNTSERSPGTASFNVGVMLFLTRRSSVVLLPLTKSPNLCTKILTNKDFETNIKGLRAIGDGASVTRGLQQASANGLSVAKSILNK